MVEGLAVERQPQLQPAGIVNVFAEGGGELRLAHRAALAGRAAVGRAEPLGEGAGGPRRVVGLRPPPAGEGDLAVDRGRALGAEVARHRRRPLRRGRDALVAVGALEGHVEVAAEPDAGAPPPGRNVPLSFALDVRRRRKEFWGVLRLPILARDGVVRGGGVLEVALGEVEGHAGRRRRRRHQVALRQRRLLGPRALEAVHRADAGLEGAAEVVVDRVDEAAEVPQQAEHGGGREDARNAADRAVQVVLARHARAVAHLEHDVVGRPLGLGGEHALLAALELRAGLQLLLPLDAAAARLLEGVHLRA